MSELIRRSDPPKTIRRASEAETFRYDGDRGVERTDYVAAEDHETNRHRELPAGDKLSLARALVAEIARRAPLRA